MYSLFIGIVMIMISVLFAQTSHAYPVPGELVDGEIVVTTKAGKIYKFSSNEYKVVKRGQSRVVFQDRAVYPQIIYLTFNSEAKNNRFRLLGGSGPSANLTVQSYPTYMRFSVRKEAIIGIAYDRLLTEEFSVGATILNNETFLLSIGWDF